jgi:hypothetical protein
VECHAYVCIGGLRDTKLCVQYRRNDANRGGGGDYLRGRWRWAPPSALFAYLRLTRLKPRAKHLPRFIFKVLMLLSLSKLFPSVTFVCIYNSELSQDSQLLVIAIDFLIN